MTVEIELTKAQIESIVDAYICTVSELDVLMFLRKVSSHRGHYIDQTKIVVAYISHVQKECCLPKGYFNE
jgi:hypothetical protein